MILNQIIIDGFGCFLNWKSPVLSDGINLIYGQNETGKSTVLNVISNVLYGLEKNGAAKYQPLWGGGFSARLQILQNEKSYTVARTFGKGGKLSISLENGEKLDSGTLVDILGSADRSMFSRLFAFGLDELSDLDKLLEAGSGISERIFSAGVEGAGMSAQRVMKALGDNAVAIFSAKAADNLDYLLDRLEDVERKLSYLEKEEEVYKECCKRIVNLESAINENEELLDKLLIFREKIALTDRFIVQKSTLIQAKREEQEAKNKAIIEEKQKKLKYSKICFTLFLFLIFSSWFFSSYLLLIFAVVVLIAGLVFGKDKLTNEQEVGKEENNQIENKEKELFYEMQKLFKELPKEIVSLSSISDFVGSNEKLVSKNLLELKEQLGREKQNKERLETSTQREQLINERYFLKTKIKEKFKDYIYYSTSRKIIQHTLDGYMKSRQPEVFERASMLFSSVVPEYKKVVFNQEERTVYVVDDNEKQKEIINLSRGTVEQLYLCIRLSLIEEFRKKRIALPIIIDDILVNTDIKRAERFLKLLQDYANNHQVLFFTCHAWIVELVKNLRIKAEIVNL